MKGTKIEFLRNIRGYTQEYVSQKSNIENTRYKRIEAGSIKNIQEQEMQKIAEVLGTNVEDLKNPNPYLVVNITNSNINLFQGEYNNNNPKELVDMLNKKDEQISKRDEQIDRLINLLETKIK